MASMSRPQSLKLGGYDTTPQNVTASFEELQLRAQLLGSKEPHYLAVSGCGSTACNGIYVRMLPQQEHNGVGIYYSGAGYTISREIVEDSPGFVLGTSPDALYGAESTCLSPADESLEWAPYEGKLPVPIITPLSQNIMRTWGFLQVKSGFRWSKSWVVIEGLAIAIYKDREALEQSQKNLKAGGSAKAVKREVILLKKCSLQLPETKSKKRPNKFCVVNCDGKPIKYFAADTLQDTMLWLAAIKTIIRLSSETESLVGEITEKPPRLPRNGRRRLAIPCGASKWPCNKGRNSCSIDAQLDVKAIPTDARAGTSQSQRDVDGKGGVSDSGDEGITEEGTIKASFKPSAPRIAPPPIPEMPPPAPISTPPPIPTATTSSATIAQIKSLYEKHNPDMLRALDGVLEKFKGKEDVLLNSLKKKYESDDVAGGSAAIKVTGATKEERNAQFFAEMKKKKEEEEKEKARKERERIELMTDEERAEYEAEKEKEATRQKLHGRMLDVQMRQYGIKKWKKPSSRNIEGSAKASAQASKRALNLGGRGRGRGRGRRRGRGRGKQS